MNRLALVLFICISQVGYSQSEPTSFTVDTRAEVQSNELVEVPHPVVHKIYQDAKAGNINDTKAASKMLTLLSLPVYIFDDEAPEAEKSELFKEALAAIDKVIAKWIDTDPVVEQTNSTLIS